MKSKIFFSVLAFLLIAGASSKAQNKFFVLPARVAESDYMAKTIIFEIKPEYRNFCKDNVVNIEKLNSAFTSTGAYNILKKFPGKTPPVAKFNKYGEEMVDISLIYEMNYSADISLENAINIMLASGVLKYAEPHYLRHNFTAYYPDDPYANPANAAYMQWHLEKIKAYEAWGFNPPASQGDTNIVIGITDTGTDTLHEDLSASLKKNYADPYNGLDDDNDGYIDNFKGWDLVDDDNTAQYVNGKVHGVYVTGLSSAVPDNGKGCAGTGFNCKYSPVRIADANNIITKGYEGIVYAAEHGCNIINCSWGGYGSSQFEQAIINYVAIDYDVLIVAACGNDNVYFPIYPASYDNVLSVAAVDSSDIKYYNPSDGHGSNWGTTVDIASPGVHVWTTKHGNGYDKSTGTSEAAPIVAGAAGIVKSFFPNYSAAQIAARLKATTDNIDTVNPAYAGLLGTGRLNMYKALTQNTPWIEMISYNVWDNNDETFLSGDTLRIGGVFKNFLDSSHAGTTVTITSLDTSSASIVPGEGSSILNIIPVLGTKDNYADPFQVKLSQSIPLSTEITFKLTFKDTAVNYISTRYFSITVNKDYLDIDTNLVATTMTSKGQIGYNNQLYLTQGIGFTYRDKPSYLRCGGLIAANSATQVSDNIYGVAANTFDNEFKTVSVVRKIFPPVKSDFDAITVFNDNNAGSNKLGISITNKAYAWKNYPYDNFIIMEYSIKNTGVSNLTSFYAGLFMDFDMSTDGTNDRINYDAANKMGYTYSLQGGPYSGIKLLSNGVARHYAFDKNGETNGTSNSYYVDYNFTDYYKYMALKTNVNRDIAGAGINGNDVADLISTGPYILQPGDSVIIAFALICGDHLADIQDAATAADQIYNHAGLADNDKENAIQLSEVFPNPANGKVSVNLYLPSPSGVSLDLFDSQGKFIHKIAEGKLNQGSHNFSVNTESYAAGVYFLRLNCQNTVISKEITVIK